MANIPDPVTIKNAAEGGPTIIIKGNRRRKFLMPQADKNNAVDVFVGPSRDVTAANGIRLRPGESISFPDMYHLGANGFHFYGIHDGALGDDPVVRIMAF